MICIFLTGVRTPLTPLRRVQLQQLLLGGRRRSFSGSGGWSADARVGAGYATAGEN